MNINKQFMIITMRLINAYKGLFSGTVLNVRKHNFEWKHWKSSHNFSSIVNK